MPAYPDHQDLRPAYVQATDPGAVGAGVFWLDTAGGSGIWLLKVRNAADSGWETVTAVPSGGAGGDLSGTYPNPSVVDDSHSHSSTTVTTHSTAHAHSDLSGVTSDQHHPRSHDHSAAADSVALIPESLNVTKSVRFSNMLSVTLTADQNDWAPTGFADAFFIEITCTGAERVISGIAGGAAGREIILSVPSTSTFGIVLLAQSTSSAAANRIAARANFSVVPNENVRLTYDGAAARWVPNQTFHAHTHSTATDGGQLTDAAIDAAAAIAMTKLANYSEATYTPQLDQGVTTNIAKTVTKAKYTRIGNMIIGSVRLDITGTGTAGSQITVTLPVAAAAGFNAVAIGAGQYYDASAAQNYAGTIFPSSSTQVYVSADQQSGNGVGLTPNIAVASGDVINFVFAYPVS